MLVIMAGIHKMLARIANKADTDQTATAFAVWSGSALCLPRLLWQATSVGNFKTELCS